MKLYIIALDPATGKYSKLEPKATDDKDVPPTGVMFGLIVSYSLVSYEEAAQKARDAIRTEPKQGRKN